MEIKASASVVVTNSLLFRLLLLFLILGRRKVGGATSSSYPEVHISDKEELIKQWAPVVWLHSEERFYPSSVIDFLQHVKPSTQEGGYLVTVYNNGLKIILPSLPRGTSSWDTNLLASYNTDCRRCPLPNYLHGEKPGETYTPPTYAVIHSCSFPRRKRRHSQNRNTNYTESLQDSSVKGYTNSKTLSKTHELPSPSDRKKTTIWKSMPTSFTLATTLPTYSALSTEQTDESFRQLGNYSNNLNTSHDEEHKSNLVSQNTQNTTVTNNQLNLNIYKNTSNQSETTNTTNKQIIFLQTVKSDLQDNNTRKSVPNTTHVLEDSHAIHSQKSYILKTEDKTDLSVGTENTEQSQTKPKKRHAITKLNQRFSVTYWMFYPYNYGKEMCTTNLGFFGRILKPTTNNECYGETIPMGNHVGDWEHITIEFKGQLPTNLYISSHNFGAFYSYDSYNHVFRYTSEDTREGFPLSPEYPRFLQLHENHPVIFAALGSHGLWPTPGTHHYNSLPSLEDKTDFGTPWQTWLNLEVIDFKQQQNFNHIQRHWLYYGGRWGNPSSNCHTLMGGFCELNQGPTGIPRKRINFPCS